MHRITCPNSTITDPNLHSTIPARIKPKPTYSQLPPRPKFNQNLPIFNYHLPKVPTITCPSLITICRNSTITCQNATITCPYSLVHCLILTVFNLMSIETCLNLVYTSLNSTLSLAFLHSTLISPNSIVTYPY